MGSDLTQARLVKQSYGIAMAQGCYGGPRGIWLECTSCPESQVIAGSRFEDDPYVNISDAEAVGVFQRHGWTGEGERMLKARCPSCSTAQGARHG